jgi:hypothetical protein
MYSRIAPALVLAAAFSFNAYGSSDLVCDMMGNYASVAQQEKDSGASMEESYAALISMIGPSIDELSASEKEKASLASLIKSVYGWVYDSDVDALQTKKLVSNKCSALMVAAEDTDRFCRAESALYKIAFSMYLDGFEFDDSRKSLREKSYLFSGAFDNSKRMISSIDKVTEIIYRNDIDKIPHPEGYLGECLSEEISKTNYLQIK